MSTEKTGDGVAQFLLIRKGTKYSTGFAFLLHKVKAPHLLHFCLSEFFLEKSSDTSNHFGENYATILMFMIYISRYQ